MWGQAPFRVSAANILVAPPAARQANVLVTFCGNGIVEPGEECDPGSHCADSTDCTSDPTVCIPGGIPIGDGVCRVTGFNDCTVDCKKVVGGGSRPPVTQVSITDITARPEQRYSGNGNNYDTEFYFYLLNSDNSNHTIPVYQYPISLTSNASGVAYPNVTLPDNVTPGTYDALIKSKAHLAKLQDNFYLKAGDNSINFTSPDNSAAIGSSVLTAGDIDGAGNSPNSFGDNVINSVDLSILLSQIGSSDPSGNSIRSNLNQDNTVNQSDLNILLGNIDKEGDK
jgi:hypothetical protein